SGSPTSPTGPAPAPSSRSSSATRSVARSPGRYTCAARRPGPPGRPPRSGSGRGATTPRCERGRRKTGDTTPNRARHGALTGSVGRRVEPHPPACLLRGTRAMNDAQHRPDHGPLAGFTVGVTAARRADELGALLERRGAAVLHAPAL